MKTFCSEGAEKVGVCSKRYSTECELFFIIIAPDTSKHPKNWNAFLAVTNPELVGLCFDTGHYSLAAAEILIGFMEKLWNRIWHVHFKDFSLQVACHHSKIIGIISNRCSMVFFANWEKGMWILRPSRIYWKIKIMTIGLLLSRMYCRVWANPGQCAGDNRKYLRSIGL